MSDGTVNNGGKGVDDETSHFPLEPSDPVGRIEAVISRYRNAPSTTKPPFEQVLFANNNLHLVSANSASPNESAAIFEFNATSSLCSVRKYLQGAATALVFDIATGLTLAPIVRRDFWYYGGVTRNLNITYLRPTPEGTTVTVECEIAAIGRRVATITAKMKNKGNSKLLAMVDHHLIIVDGDASTDKFIVNKTKSPSSAL